MIKNLISQPHPFAAGNAIQGASVNIKSLLLMTLVFLTFSNTTHAGGAPASCSKPIKKLECLPTDGSQSVTQIDFFAGSNCGDQLSFQNGNGYPETVTAFTQLTYESNTMLVSKKLFSLISFESFLLPLNGGPGHVVKRHWNIDSFGQIDFDNPILEDIQVECRPL